MPDDKQLDYLISVLYEAVLDASRWQEAVALIGQYAGGVDAQMFTLEKQTLRLISVVTAGTRMSLQAGANYAEHYIPMDPGVAFIRNMVGYEWQCCDRILGKSFVDRNEFYQDFLIPSGFRYRMAAIVDRDEDYVTTLGCIRAADQIPFAEANILAANRFIGHLQKALRLQTHTQNLQAKVDLGAMAIDALALSMLIVDGKGAILHLNAQAGYLLSSRFSGLISKSGCLSCTHPGNKQKLSALMAEATGYPATGGAMLLRNQEARQLFVTPLPAVSPLSRDWQAPLALVLVVDAGKNLSSLQLMGKLYDLSAAELRIASALLAGKSPEAYALEAGVTMNTVRTQLKNLFRKTGACRQSELVAVLSQLPPLYS